MGLLLGPRRTVRAYRASSAGPSLFDEPFGDYESLLSMSVGELRERLGVPRDGLCGARKLHHGAPALAS